MRDPWDFAEGTASVRRSDKDGLGAKPLEEFNASLPALRLAWGVCFG